MAWNSFGHGSAKDGSFRRTGSRSTLYVFSLCLNIILAVLAFAVLRHGVFRHPYPPDNTTTSLRALTKLAALEETASSATETFATAAKREALTAKCRGKRCSMCADEDECCFDDPRQTVFLAILCKSMPANIQRRQASRTVWDQMVRVDHFYSDFVLPKQIFFAFVVGKSQSSDINEAVDGESRLYRDMLIGDFEDIEENQTAKLLWSLRWLRETIRFSYLLMANDDAFVNFFSLVQWLVVSPPRKIYAGRLESNVLVVRDPQSKWYVKRGFYSPETYPPYHQGFGYVLSCDLAEDALKYVKGIPLFGLDDSVMGMLMYVAGVKAVSNPRFHAAPPYCQKNEDPHPLVIGNANGQNFIQYMKDVLYIGCPVCKGKEGNWKKTRRKIR